MPGTRKLGRATDSRNAMLRAMVTQMTAATALSRGMPASASMEGTTKIR